MLTMDDIDRANKRIKTANDKYDADYQNFTHRLDQEEKKIQSRCESFERNKAGIISAHGNVNASEDDLIEINAGGKIVAAKRGTLCQVRGTKLEALFSGRWDKELQRDDNGRVFLNVNSEAFQTIVDYLNELAISPADDLPQLPTSTDSEKKTNIEHLLGIFGVKHSNQFDSEIVTDDADAGLLHEWLKEDGSDGKFKLLYRSSRDGTSSQAFHSKCDNKGCTLTVIETDEGLKLGGYSNTSWTSPPMNRVFWPGANKAFLFVLPGGTVYSPCKMKLKDKMNKHAVFHHDSWGPTFGDGPDLSISMNGRRHMLVTDPDSYEAGPLGCLCHCINEVEVFQVKGTSDNASLGISTVPIQNTTSFSQEVNDALNSKLQTLKKTEQRISALEKDLEDEQKFVDLFASGETKDVVKLNVSGTMVATKRSTLMFYEDSALASQFDDSKWTEKGSKNNRVKDWTPEDVKVWIEGVDGIAADIANLFLADKITGRELLALGKDELYRIGIQRPATVSLLFDEIQNLEENSKDVTTLIEHSPYCFGRLLDYLRMKELQSQSLVEAGSDIPAVRESERSRFERVVKYFFPGESAKLILEP